MNLLTIRGPFGLLLTPPRVSAANSSIWSMQMRLRSTILALIVDLGEVRAFPGWTHLAHRSL